MSNENITLKLEISKINPCQSIIIKDPSYDRDVWCAFQDDNCSSFTHAKGLVTSSKDHYKDADIEFDYISTNFSFVIGTNGFINQVFLRTDETGEINEYKRKGSLIDNLISEETEIGCDTAQFSFGSEKTFNAFSIKTGADGFIGDVLLFKDPDDLSPVGLLFKGSLDGACVKPEMLYESFIAAFGIERTKEKSVTEKISEAKTRKRNLSDKTGTKETAKDRDL